MKLTGCHLQKKIQGGFVGVAIVADPRPYGSVFDRVDEQIERSKEAVEEESLS
jgi:hypothetical protein